MLKYTTTRMIELSDWDSLVQKTYGRPYSFQQQQGCQPRGTVGFSVPDENENEEYMNDSIPEVINGDEMGVKFKVWLERDPNYVPPNKDRWSNNLFWVRNFYPNLQTVANDLHTKGLIEAGDYVIDIDW